MSVFITFALGVVLVCNFVILALTILRLPDPTTTATTHHSHSDNKLLIGKFGEMMIKMLPEDLAFTVFIPSEKAFKRDLRLDPSDSFVGEKMNDTYAVVSRVLGFSTVPRSIGSETVAFGKEISYDSNGSHHRHRRPRVLLSTPSRRNRLRILQSYSQVVGLLLREVSI